MEKYNKLWRLFFAIGMITIAVQQMALAIFVPVVIPLWPAWLPGQLVCVYVFGLALVTACAAIIFEKKARNASLLMAAVFLLLLLLFQVPGQLFGPYSPLHIGLWTNAFKELTFAGGALIVAGSFPSENNSSDFIKLMERFIPAGKYFVAITMVVFGYMHFLYPEFVASLVPNWIPWHLFWTDFAGIALMAGGLGIILNIKLRLAAGLLGLMIFLWLIVLHIPRAFTAWHDANEWTSVFEALMFSGIAFLLAGKPRN